MMVVFKFANGAEIRDTIHGQMVPCCCSMKIRLVPDSDEQICFWFELVDELPSGAVVFRETTQARVRKIWKGEA